MGTYKHISGKQEWMLQEDVDYHAQVGNLLGAKALKITKSIQKPTANETSI